MIEKAFFTRLRLMGVKSGIIEIYYVSSGFEPVIAINFYDEVTGVDYLLDSIFLGEFNTIKESYVIGEFNLSCIKNGKEAIMAEKLLSEKGEEMEFDIVTRANELAQEIRGRASIDVKVIVRIQGKPEVVTEIDQKMWNASQVLEGIDDDY